MPTKQRQHIEWNGVTQSLHKWSQQLGLTYQCLYSRVHFYKWSIDKAFSTPKRAQRRHVSLHNVQSVDPQTVAQATFAADCIQPIVVTIPLERTRFAAFLTQLKPAAKLTLSVADLTTLVSN